MARPVQAATMRDSTGHDEGAGRMNQTRQKEPGSERATHLEQQSSAPASVLEINDGDWPGGVAPALVTSRFRKQSAGPEPGGRC